MKEKSENFRIYLYIIISILCWSFSFIWTKIALESFPPLTLISLRLVLASVLLFGFLKLTDRIQKLDKTDLKLFFALAFFEPYLYFVGETYGLTMVKPTLASVIVSTIPVFAPFFAFVFIKERFTIINMLGISISIFGVYLIVNQSNDNKTTSAFGIALVFLAVLSAVAYGLILRKIPKKYTATNIIFYQSLIGLIFFIPTALIVDLKQLPHIIIYPKAVGAILMLTIFASVIAFILFADVVRKIGITKSQVFINLIPVFTALFSWILFKEMLNSLQWIGIFIVILGVFVSQSKKKQCLL
ncbi:MAG: DMT family transporter [Bacteroidales bacterium]|nr:DMT family transporter [Bacteroidales bacterium]